MLIKKSFPIYNTRRYGRPWGAQVTLTNGIKPNYEFVGHWDGECVVMHATGGDVVAFGQKDFAKPNKSLRQMYSVDAQGNLTEITEAQARDILSTK